MPLDAVFCQGLFKSEVSLGMEALVPLGTLGNLGNLGKLGKFGKLGKLGKLRNSFTFISVTL